MVRETCVRPEDLIQPFFVVEGQGKKEAIASMPGIFRYSLDRLLKTIEQYRKTGGCAGLFFGIPLKKDLKASQAYAPGGVVQKAIRAIKKEFPDFLVITDVCLCSYMSHGHCGVIKHKEVDNDETLALLGKTALSHAEAGCDVVAPSDMMDFRVAHIRDRLDEHGFCNIPIMSYAVKYASSFYGPFREAAHSTPQFGDRKSYQMDYANQREALKEAQRDVQEGADWVMVKPALPYLDVISLLRRELSVPIVAYNVSGEYSMIKAASQLKWLDEQSAVLESLTAIKRAGANLIITYYAQEALKWL